MASRSIARADRRATLRASVRVAGLIAALLVCVPLHGLWRLFRLPSPWPRLYEVLPPLLAATFVFWKTRALVAVAPAYLYLGYLFADHLLLPQSRLVKWLRNGSAVLFALGYGPVVLAAMGAPPVPAEPALAAVCLGGLFPYLYEHTRTAMGVVRGFALAVVDGLWHLVPASLVGRAGATAGEVQLSATPPDALFYVRLPGLVAGKVDTPDMRFKGAPHPLIDRPPVLLPAPPPEPRKQLSSPLSRMTSRPRCLTYQSRDRGTSRTSKAT